MTSLDSHHPAILDEIARDLSGNLGFPTCLDVDVLIRDTLADPSARLKSVATAVGIFPHTVPTVRP